MPDLVLVNAGQLITCEGRGATAEKQLGLIEGGAMVVEGGKVSWVGTAKALRRRGVGKARRTIDAEGRLVTPGFVDPHTHLVFAGSREDELERKIAGESYTSILGSGGGILRTVRDTRRATAEEIAKQSDDRLNQLLRKGVTTAEVKTGYGQTVTHELKLLEAIAQLRKMSKVEVVSTILGLHATPPEFKRPEDYVDYAIRKLLPAVANFRERPSFSDAFCEEGVFSKEECARYLQASRASGFACKLHADEFQDSGGASLAAETDCVSADHLGKSDGSGLEKLAKRGVTAVLLPGTALYSGIAYADARRVIGLGCRVALGTDLSPNSWIESPQLVMSLACSGMRMTPAEALLGCTRNAARAIGRDDVGSLKEGSKADFVVHSLQGFKFLPYRVGGQYVRAVFKEGKEVFSGEKA